MILIKLIQELSQSDYIAVGMKVNSRIEIPCICDIRVSIRLLLRTEKRSCQHLAVYSCFHAFSESFKNVHVTQQTTTFHNSNGRRH